MNQRKAFTVIGFADADMRVETFVEEVFAPDASAAWDKAVKRVRRNADRPDDWENATEIVCLHGHGLIV